MTIENVPTYVHQSGVTIVVEGTGADVQPQDVEIPVLPAIDARGWGELSKP